MGLFDIPAPLFTAIDSLLGFLPVYTRLLLWAFITAVLSMALYWLFSAQDKVAAVKHRAVTARNRMAAYKGTEFNEMLPLAKESLAASGKHFIVVLGPAILSSLPALTLIVWVSNQFSHSAPAPGTTVALWSNPASALTAPSLDAATDIASGSYTVQWPVADSELTVSNTTGMTLFTLPLQANVPIVHQREWWNYLIGNPNGYLPEGSGVMEVRFDLPAVEHLAFGPAWIRGWEFSYFVLLILASFAIKWAFRIH